MRHTFKLLALTAALLVALDLVVAGALRVLDTPAGTHPLVRYFEYGRSVPGKLDRWLARPEQRDNLFGVAWQPSEMAKSARQFAAEDPALGPVMRSYGMSFAGNILKGARSHAPDLRIDLHGGPAAPPNLAYDTFLRDKPNRKVGDVVVLGLLSSSVPAMMSLSNRSWAFEQPAPLTYGIYYPAPDGPGLIRTAPLIDSEQDERATRTDPQAAAAWHQQLRGQDGFYSAYAFGAPAFDVSPFARLVRRALAIGAEAETKAAFWEPGGYPYEEVLRRMVRDFAAEARRDDLVPVVFVIQSRNPGDDDIYSVVKTTLEGHDIPYLATTRYHDPSDLAGFRPDGHYTRATDARFGAAFLKILEMQGVAH